MKTKKNKLSSFSKIKHLLKITEALIIRNENVERELKAFTSEMERQINFLCKRMEKHEGNPIHSIKILKEVDDENDDQKLQWLPWPYGHWNA